MQWHLPPGSSSVEPPAEYLPSVSTRISSSAAQPAIPRQEQSLCRFDNIGWQYADKKRATSHLAIDDEPSRRQDTMQIILDELNPDSAALPVWIGQTCLLHEMISCEIQEQAVRKTQYLLFQQSLHLSHRQDQFFTSISSPWAYEVAELGPFESQERGLMQGHVKLRGGETLLVYHNHSVSSKTHTPTRGRNKRICFPVLSHAVRTSSAARPDVRFLGEFNSVLDSLTAFSASS